MPGKVLFLRNDPTSPEALLGEVFSELGFAVSTFEVVPALRVSDPIVDVTFPEPSHYDVIVTLGARWSVYDERLIESWVGSEMDMVRRGLDAGVGVLGVCFGGQLLAQLLGGSVERSSSPEIGWCDVQSTNSIIPPGPWFEWHFDRWTLPPGAVEVARNDSASQAFVQGRALALQFHPELDREVLDMWIADDRDGDAAELGTSHDNLRSRTGVELDDAARRLRLLVAGFLDEVATNTVDATDPALRPRLR